MKFLLLFGFVMSLVRVASGEVEVTHEVFSMPLKDAAKLRRERLGGAASYERVLGMVAGEKARLERWMVVKVVVGQGVTLEEIEEYIYTTEYEPSNFTPMVGSGLQAYKIPPFPIPTTAMAYDTKNVGNTLELELQKNGGCFGLRLTAVEVSVTGVDEFGEKTGKVEMPRFAVQVLKTGVEVVPGKAALVGTVSPPRDWDAEGEKRVWLAFVTVTEEKK